MVTITNGIEEISQPFSSFPVLQVDTTDIN